MKRNFMKSIIETLSFNKRAISIIIGLCIIFTGSIFISSYHKSRNITATNLSTSKHKSQKPKPTKKENEKTEVKDTQSKTQVVASTASAQNTNQSQRLYTNKARLIDKLPLKDSGQAIIVETPNESSAAMKLFTYEKDNSNTWRLKLTTKGVVGVKGISLNKKEGDLKTPEGIFSFLFEFGSAPNPGTKMEYKRTHPGDYWSSSRTIKEYNTWVTYKGSPETRFGHGNYQNLYTTSSYKYAAAINYNYGTNKIIGNGSAVFFHIAPRNGGGTPGCVGIPETSLVQILKWMNPSKNPKIAIGTAKYLSSL
ncbi:hypothetical protein NL50_13195 [Clostridium acetobutylicum]|nr:hypothetical protein NL50_13195 [Clostridium acetobutylicum]